MKTILGAACLPLGLLLVLAAGPAGAQPPAGLNSRLQPKFSPYLNLLRQGADPAINYYGIVRPEITFRSSIQRLQQDQATLGTQEQTLATYMALPPTGHKSGFQTQTRYFMTGGARAVAGPPRGAPQGNPAFPKQGKR